MTDWIGPLSAWPFGLYKFEILIRSQSLQTTYLASRSGLSSLISLSFCVSMPAFINAFNFCESWWHDGHGDGLDFKLETWTFFQHDMMDFVLIMDTIIQCYLICPPTAPHYHYHVQRRRIVSVCACVCVCGGGGVGFPKMDAYAASRFWVYFPPSCHYFILQSID